MELSAGEFISHLIAFVAGGGAVFAIQTIRFKTKITKVDQSHAKAGGNIAGGDIAEGDILKGDEH